MGGLSEFSRRWRQAPACSLGAGSSTRGAVSAGKGREQAGDRFCQTRPSLLLARRLPDTTVMGRAQAATSVVKARKDFGGVFSAWMKTSCELCSWADTGTTAAAQPVLGEGRRDGRCRGSGSPTGSGGGLRRPWDISQRRAGLQQSDSLPWSRGFISGGSHCLQLAQLADPPGPVQAWKSSPWLLGKGPEDVGTTH